MNRDFEFRQLLRAYRAGIIGEIGTGEPLYAPSNTWDVTGEADMSASEEKVLRAAGRAGLENDRREANDF